MFNVSKQLSAIENFNDDGDVNLIESIINNSFMLFNGDDLLKDYLTYFSIDINENTMISEVNSLLESTLLMDLNK